MNEKQSAEWFIDVVSLPFAAVDTFLEELESRICEEDFPLTQCGRILLRAACDYLDRAIEMVEKETGRIDLYLNRNNPSHSDLMKPVVRAVIEGRPPRSPLPPAPVANPQ